MKTVWLLRTKIDGVEYPLVFDGSLTERSVMNILHHEFGMASEMIIPLSLQLVRVEGTPYQG